MRGWVEVPVVLILSRRDTHWRTLLLLLAAMLASCSAELEQRPPPDAAIPELALEGEPGMLTHACAYTRRGAALASRTIDLAQAEAVRQACLQQRAILELAGAVRALADRPVAISDR